MSFWGLLFYVSTAVVYIAVGATVVGWIRSLRSDPPHR